MSATCWQTCTAVAYPTSDCTCVGGGSLAPKFIPRSTTCDPATSDEDLKSCPKCTATMNHTIEALCYGGGGVPLCTTQATGYWKCTGCKTACDYQQKPWWWIILSVLGGVLLVFFVLAASG